MRIPQRALAAFTAAAALLAAAPAFAQTPSKEIAPKEARIGPPPSMAVVEAFTRYELLAPGSGKFHILYEVTENEPGARFFFNPIRKGSVSSEKSVVDLATGKPLQFGVVAGKDAVAQEPRLDPTYDYIRVALARPVPTDGGEGRMLIDKTYEDAKSYYVDGSDIVFDRPLGVKRNSVVLPLGYRLVSCNYPSQVIQEADGRIKISFWNATPGEAPLVLRARPAHLGDGPSALDKVVDERAMQNRDIVYFLKPPETHAFELYHDYTESRPGTAFYANVVRDGSTVENPSGRNLDTGAPLKVEVLKGDAITKANLPDEDRPRTVTPQSEVAVFRYPALGPGESARLRFTETYTDPVSYTLRGGELVFKRTLGRAADAVVLPAGWRLTDSSVPAAVTETKDGRTRLDFINPRLDEIDVTITARRSDS